MKRLFFYLLAVFATLVVGCEKFDDSALWDKINSLEGRIAALEQLCSQMNTNITSLQTVVSALQNNDYVTNIAPITEGDKTIGYTITFSKSQSITIYLSGDSVTSDIGLKKADDGFYYWTLNGEWLLDDSGNKVRAEGVTPKLKIENEYWYASYDGGENWDKLGKATTENDNEGDSMFSDIDYDDNYVYITLADGTELVVPRHYLPANNQIWYTSTDGEVIEPTESANFGANIVSNTYVNGKGVITFDGEVSTIGGRAFSQCLRLTSITIPNSVMSIENADVFYNCDNLAKFYGKFASEDGRCLVIDDRLVCFAPSGLSSYIIPYGITEIGQAAFSCYDNIESVTIPESVTKIEKLAFYSCNGLKEFKGKFSSEDGKCLIVDGVLNSFAVASELTSYTIPENVTTIGWCAFAGAENLENITLHNNIETIDRYSFRHCTSLTSVIIPENVTFIGEQAFYRCSSLKSVYCKPTTPPVLAFLSDPGSYYVFDDNNSDRKIYVPTASVDAYKSANGWNDYAEDIEGYDYESNPGGGIVFVPGIGESGSR